eukprot:3702419-Alexandrium_andersonii.AAC.1
MAGRTLRDTCGKWAREAIRETSGKDGHGLEATCSDLAEAFLNERSYPSGRFFITVLPPQLVQLLSCCWCCIDCITAVTTASAAGAAGVASAETATAANAASVAAAAIATTAAT